MVGCMLGVGVGSFEVGQRHDEMDLTLIDNQRVAYLMQPSCVLGHSLVTELAFQCFNQLIVANIVLHVCGIMTSQSSDCSNARCASGFSLGPEVSFTCRPAL